MANAKITILQHCFDFSSYGACKISKEFYHNLTSSCRWLQLLCSHTWARRGIGGDFSPLRYRRFVGHFLRGIVGEKGKKKKGKKKIRGKDEESIVF